MALGKVEYIDPTNPTVGRVVEDESEQIYPYNDPDFANKGLAVGDPCTYEIDYTFKDPVATNLKPYAPKEIIINTVYNGNLTVNPGETVKVKQGGGVRGSIAINSGFLFVENGGEVIGNTTINEQGSAKVRQGGVVRGSIAINSGCSLKIVNNGLVEGNITEIKANRLTVGNNNGGGNIKGSISIDKIRHVSITAESKINCG